MESCRLYKNTVLLEFDSERHVYLVDGKRVASVTSALGCISKPALVPWAAKVTADYVESHLIPGVSLDEVQIKNLCKEAKMAHRAKKEGAADIGTFVHEWIEQYIKVGRPNDPINPQVKAGVDAFLQWVDENKVEFIASEKKVYSKEYNFCGTLDFLATVNGKRMLGDIKTSSGIYDEMFFQTSAYQLALQEEHPEEKFEGQIIVNCRKTGELDTRISLEYEENAKAFICALGLYRRINAMKESL